MRTSVMPICIGLFGTAIALNLTAAAQAKPSAAIPATAPTSVSDLPSARPGAGLTATPSGASHVTWTGSTLAIDGGGDNLRSILVQVMRATGLKVTGGIPDERVFGKYGPAPVQQVLGQLFDGLSVNMLLLNDSPTRPKELVLSARTGGVTPPMASPIGAEEGGGGGNAGSGRQQGRPRFGGPTSGPPDQPNQQAGQPGQQPPNGADNPNGGAPPATPPSATGTTDSTSSDTNGTRTPEQIFEELRKRQQGGATPQ